MFLRIDPGSGVPIYRQIMDGVRYSLATGALSPGERLPSVRELATGLGVNPTTIQKAYGELEHLGVIEMRRGQGTFIAERPPHPDGDERHEAIAREVRRLVVRAAELGIDPAELAEIVRRAVEEGEV